MLVWQKSLVLVREIYNLTRAFPAFERYALGDQMRRAAVSIPSNIAEGQAHYSDREFVHFLRHSLGSAAELDTQILISIDLGYAAQPECAATLNRAEEISRMLAGLIASITAHN